jgi:cytidylate kinase
MKIAIDGPSASGKGTISKILSQKLNAYYLNTGKIYRIIAFLANKEFLANGKSGDLNQIAIKFANEINQHFKEQAEEKGIYTEENAKITSQIASFPEVRKALLEFQQEFVSKNDNIILEGRDIGTVIMPNADFKFYLDASPEERAKRRVLQLGSNEDFQKILNDISLRDKNDSERETSALKMASDAYYIDTTSKTIDEVISVMLSIITPLK